MTRLLRAVLGVVVAATLGAGTAQAGGQAAAEPAAAPPLVLARQGSFFVGGRDLESVSLMTVPGLPAGGTVSVEQTYVRYQVPVAARKPPIILVHGCCLTGKSWETTPDGRMGWDEAFVRAGYPTYVVDQAGRGRSATDITPLVAAREGTSPARDLPKVRALSHELAWTVFRFGPAPGATFPGLQFPIEAQGELWKQMVPDWNLAQPEPSPTVAGLEELTRQVGGAVLISHSQSGIFPFQLAQRRAGAVKAIIALEPGECPSADAPMDAYRGVPILIVFGDFIARSAHWAATQASCRRFVTAARAAGLDAELIALPDAGFPGNSHMIMQDRNSLQVAAWLDQWVTRHAPRGAASGGKETARP